MFETILKSLVSQVDGALGAIFLDGDGEAVTWHTHGDGNELRLRAAYVAVLVRTSRSIAARLRSGTVTSMLVEYDNSQFLIENLVRGYFLALELEKSANLGQAFLQVRPVVEALCQEIAA